VLKYLIPKEKFKELHTELINKNKERIIYKKIKGFSIDEKIDFDVENKINYTYSYQKQNSILIKNTIKTLPQ